MGMKITSGAQIKQQKRGYKLAVQQFERENLYKDLKCTAEILELE